MIHCLCFVDTTLFTKENINLIFFLNFEGNVTVQDSYQGNFIIGNVSLITRSTAASTKDNRFPVYWQLKTVVIHVQFIACNYCMQLLHAIYCM